MGVCGRGKWRSFSNHAPGAGEAAQSFSHYALLDIRSQWAKRREALRGEVTAKAFHQRFAPPELAAFFVSFRGEVRFDAENLYVTFLCRGI